MNFLKSFKAIVFVSTMVFFVSCSNDVVTSTGGLVGNDSFVRETITYDVVVESEEVDFVYSNLLSTYLLGDYTSSDFGTVNASVVSQISAESYPVERIDSTEYVLTTTSTDIKAYLEIPMTLSSDSDDSSSFELSNAVGDTESVFDFTVSTFETYLEEFNEDATTRVYYSNGTNNVNEKEDLGTLTELGSLTNYSFESSYTEVDTLVIDLDSDYFTTNLLDKLDDGDIASDDDLIELFKGLKIEVTKSSGDGLVVPFNLGLANLKIEYTNVRDGVDDVAKELTFDLEGVLYNLYDHDHTNSAAVNEVYVQGAGGYNATVDLSEFITANSTAFLDDSWLINQATIKLYVKEEESGDYTDVLDALLIYGDYLDDDNEEIEVLVHSAVQFENTEDETDPYVEFFLTDLIKEALEDGDINELRIKESRSETSSVDLRSATAKGVVFLNGSEDDTKAPVFELIYSKIEN